MEKENIALKCNIHLITKELETRMSELEHGREAAELASNQHAEVMKKVTKLDDECNRLRTLLRKKLPSRASIPSTFLYVIPFDLSSTSIQAISDVHCLTDSCRVQAPQRWYG